MISPTFWRLIGAVIIQTVINWPFAFAEQPQAVLSGSKDGLGPSIESTRANAPRIFNAIHSSMVCSPVDSKTCLRPFPLWLLDMGLLFGRPFLFRTFFV